MEKPAKKPAKRAVLFVRSNHEEQVVEQQVEALRQCAKKLGIKVVRTVTLPHTSANDPATGTASADLLRGGGARNDFDMIMTTDPSRLARGAEEGHRLSNRLTAAGMVLVHSHASV